LAKFTRVPVCAPCLEPTEPFEAEFFCLSCRTPFRNAYPLDEQGLCGLCRSGLTGFDAAYSYGAYEGRLRELIHLFKYARMKPLAKRLGDFMSRALPREQSFDLAVPVPLHWLREWRRGFNQSELLAREAARRCGIPVIRALRRVANTRAQAGLSNTGRRENVARAFRAKRGASLSGRRVLLVDDVMTTGATARACALALKAAGAKSVTLFTLARVDRRFAQGNTHLARGGFR
jgi:competence protein ComFC